MTSNIQFAERMEEKASDATGRENWVASLPEKKKRKNSNIAKDCLGEEQVISSENRIVSIWLVLFFAIRKITVDTFSTKLSSAFSWLNDSAEQFSHDHIQGNSNTLLEHLGGEWMSCSIFGVQRERRLIKIYNAKVANRMKSFLKQIMRIFHIETCYKVNPATTSFALRYYSLHTLQHA